MFVMLILLVLVLPARAQALTSDQSRCLDGMHRQAAKVAKTQAKQSAKCVKNAIKGKIALGLADSCETSDPDALAKLAKVEAKTVDIDLRFCVVAPPFGHTGAAIVNASSVAGALALTDELFGPSLAAGLITSDSDEGAASLQLALAKAASKLQRLYLRTFRKSSKAIASSALSWDEPDFEGVFVADVRWPNLLPNAAVAKTDKRFSKLVANGTAAISTFSACSAAATSLDLAECLAGRLNCATCEMLTVAVGATSACDLLDNDVGDVSCASPTTTTSTTTTTTMPPGLTVDLTAYRPQSETYGSPLLRRPVLEADEELVGAGVRINGDDDDGNLLADRDDTSVAGENDLVEVELAVSQAPAPAGFEYAIRRSNQSIKVWDSAAKGTAILDANDEAVVAFVGSSQSVWVESPNGGSAFLDFEVRTTPGGAVLSTDRINLFSFTSLVIGLHGEFQFPTDPPFGVNEGISVLAIALHELGYDSHMYDEDDVAADGSGAVYDEIVDAIQNRGVTEIAMYGFSHGGGSLYDLTERLDNNSGSIGPFAVPYTGYIDGIENDGTFDLDAEVRLPIGSAYHVNYYQNNIFTIGLIWGDSVPGASVDVNVTDTGWGAGLLHTSITTHINVEDGILNPLLVRVAR